MTVVDDGVGLPKKALDLATSTNSDIAEKPTALPIVPDDSRLNRVVSTNGTGIGLTNLRARLETLYGPDHLLELAARAERGVTVRIEIPWRSASPIETNSVSAVS